ncbi:DUF423 domain-containing protein [Tumebacillus permanentifrigoris]|uniref:Uncharacterized membrane protein YgdD (TMEM256/DUF423 family) n=1 Tax=Tumebacillus permanentifrigoris TaxID=378543 RepID=A0A316E0Q0_9BACL|nr:DUF423 domain-containing protein [Tumebacillus permanentifrigoris]PWK16390.1 uncharacterized membrane protein YgdD (TMEM256/DUF423 family) [Tumebacillus permanentifrigoris]
MTRKFTILGSILMLLSVAIGAFGAHALKPVLLENNLQSTFETGVHYHMIHGFAILLIALLADKFAKQTKLLNVAGWLFFAGILLFSGSLYVLAVTNITILGAVTPLGGVCFLVAWALVALAAARSAR